MRFSAPIMLANLLQTSYQFADSLWIGNLLGAEALGAVAVSSVVIFTVLAFVIGLNNAALTILSQQRGRSDHEGVARYLDAFVVILFVAAVALGAAGYALSPTLLRLLGTPEAIMGEATSYLQVTFLGIVFLFGYNFISTVLRALGDSRTPMRFVAVMATIGLLLVILADHAIGLFIDEPEAAAFGARYLRTVSLFYPFLGINFVLNGTVRAAGAMYQVLALNVISFWVLRFPLTSLFAGWLDEDGIGVGIATSFVISSGFAVLYYRYGRWRERRLFQEAPPEELDRTDRTSLPAEAQ